MSDIHRLITDVQKDITLLNTVKYFVENCVASEVAVVAVKGSGYDITEEEWASVFKQKVNEELDESTLELVVGGLVLYPPEKPD